MSNSDQLLVIVAMMIVDRNKNAVSGAARDLDNETLVRRGQRHEEA